MTQDGRIFKHLLLFGMVTDNESTLRTTQTSPYGGSWTTPCR